jgi:hypothetical protein
MVSRAIWRKNHCQERVTASVTGPQSMRLFFVDHLKKRVYNPLSKTLEDRISNLTREIENIPAQTLKETYLKKKIKVSFVPQNKWGVTKTRDGTGTGRTILKHGTGPSRKK